MTVWYTDPSNVAQLYRYLADQQRIDRDDIADLIERPWRWTPEWSEYRAALAAEVTA